MYFIRTINVADSTDITRELGASSELEDVLGDLPLQRLPVQHDLQVLNVVPPILAFTHSGDSPVGHSLPLVGMQPFDQLVIVKRFKPKA